MVFPFNPSTWPNNAEYRGEPRADDGCTHITGRRLRSMEATPCSDLRRNMVGNGNRFVDTASTMDDNRKDDVIHVGHSGAVASKPRGAPVRRFCKASQVVDDTLRHEIETGIIPGGAPLPRTGTDNRRSGCCGRVCARRSDHRIADRRGVPDARAAAGLDRRHRRVVTRAVPLRMIV